MSSQASTPSPLDVVVTQLNKVSFHSTRASDSPETSGPATGGRGVPHGWSADADISRARALKQRFLLALVSGFVFIYFERVQAREGQRERERERERDSQVVSTPSEPDTWLDPVDHETMT